MESFYPVSLSYRFAVLVALAEFQLLSSPVRVVAVVFLGADGQRFIIAECSLGQHSHTRAHTHTHPHTHTRSHPPRCVVPHHPRAPGPWPSRGWSLWRQVAAAGRAPARQE